MGISAFSVRLQHKIKRCWQVLHGGKEKYTFYPLPGYFWPEGQIFNSLWNIKLYTLTLVTVYGPNYDDPTFFQNLFSIMPIYLTQTLC